MIHIIPLTSYLTISNANRHIRYMSLDDSMTVGVLCDYPSGFDCIIASDVIYEEEQVGVAEQLI